MSFTKLGNSVSVIEAVYMEAERHDELDESEKLKEGPCSWNVLKEGE